MPKKNVAIEPLAKGKVSSLPHVRAITVFRAQVTTARPTNSQCGVVLCPLKQHVVHHVPSRSSTYYGRVNGHLFGGRVRVTHSLGPTERGERSGAIPSARCTRRRVFVTREGASGNVRQCILTQREKCVPKRGSTPQVAAAVPWEAGHSHGVNGAHCGKPHL